jgi:type II secretory pathway pseudopilin PulG
MVSSRTPVGRRGAAGYSLVVLIMAIAVLNIMIAAALPKWSEMIKRDKEEELISRGWQYAEAIRVFQQRFQRRPVRLEELITAKPRCIRKLWRDPMTANGQFAPIFQNQPTPIHVPGTPEAPPSQGLDPNQPQVTVGPIVGVRSRGTQKSLLAFFGHERYDEWEFRVEMLTQSGNNNPTTPTTPTRPPPRQFTGVPGVGVPGVAPPTLSTRWLGRPMPSFVPPGGMPGGGMPGGSPGGPSKPVGAYLGGGGPGKP